MNKEFEELKELNKKIMECDFYSHSNPRDKGKYLKQKNQLLKKIEKIINKLYHI